VGKTERSSLPSTCRTITSVPHTDSGCSRHSPVRQVWKVSDGAPSMLIWKPSPPTFTSVFQRNGAPLCLRHPRTPCLAPPQVGECNGVGAPVWRAHRAVDGDRKPFAAVAHLAHEARFFFHQKRPCTVCAVDVSHRTLLPTVRFPSFSACARARLAAEALSHPCWGAVPLQALASS
jgi:hypothetical protein